MNDLAVRWIRSFERFSFSFVHSTDFVQAIRWQCENAAFGIGSRYDMFEIEQIICRPRIQMIFQANWTQTKYQVVYESDFPGTKNFKKRYLENGAFPSIPWLP